MNMGLRYPMIFAATVAENIVMDRLAEGYEKAALEAAKRKTLPKGLDQELTREFSEDGVELNRPRPWIPWQNTA